MIRQQTLRAKDTAEQMPTAARKRTRKTPEARRAEILDAAARIVLAEGISAVSMERLGRDSGISKALVYNYFPSRDHLLAALLEREQAELRERGLGGAQAAKDFPELIRLTTRPYLEQVRSRGALIAALLADPSVSKLMEEENRIGRERTRRYFIRHARKAYNLPEAAAAHAVDLLWAITDEAGRQLARGAISIEEAEDYCVILISGGLQRLAQTKFATRKLTRVKSGGAGA
jgi:TetR/AcrR family transcriptional regulator, fatty acid biosynthesis regulator